MLERSSDVGRKQQCLRIVIYKDIRLLLNIYTYVTKLTFNEHTVSEFICSQSVSNVKFLPMQIQSKASSVKLLQWSRNRMGIFFPTAIFSFNEEAHIKSWFIAFQDSW